MTEPWHYIVIAFGLWFFIYISVRLGSAAYFRSKWEHFRRVINSGEDNGEK